jgi:hypothetical protein
MPGKGGLAAAQGVLPAKTTGDWEQAATAIQHMARVMISLHFIMTFVLRGDLPDEFTNKATRITSF